MWLVESKVITLNMPTTAYLNGNIGMNEFMSVYVLLKLYTQQIRSEVDSIILFVQSTKSYFDNIYTLHRLR